MESLWPHIAHNIGRFRFVSSSSSMLREKEKSHVIYSRYRPFPSQSQPSLLV
jgi:hypothetical protein